MDLEIIGLGECMNKLGESKAMSQLHGELGESEARPIHSDGDELGEFKKELGESVEDSQKVLLKMNSSSSCYTRRVTTRLW